MKLKTRLWLTFATFSVFPLILIIIAFIGIQNTLVNSVKNEYGFSTMDYATISDPAQSYIKITEGYFMDICSLSDDNPLQLEDKEYLEALNEELNQKASYILVRKDNAVYYVGNETAGETIFERLPAYGSETEEAEAGYYFSDLKKMVKQIDFIFSDGSQGSLFIVTRVNILGSKWLYIDMIIAITIIMLLTSLMLVLSIHKSIFRPIKDLGIGMHEIAEGNFDHTLNCEEKGEMGSLFKNYEQMRLRLKESIAEKVDNESKSKELITNISHDLKTPITSIKGYVEGIMDGVADTPEKMDKYIKTIYNKANDMDRLINELTIYSGIDSNRIPYNFHKINVSDYFYDCVEEVGLDLESKNIELNFENFISPDTIVIADPEQLKRVINNIISNSVKYLDRRDGVIDIRILDELDSIRIEIEDNGKGIAAKDLGSIFERFYRTDASRNSSQGGSGIGLSIVKKIIEDHGGYIWATSKEGEGTCMHFVLRKYEDAGDVEIME